MNIESFCQMLQPMASEIEMCRMEPMSAHTTFKIGGPADLFLLPKTIEALSAVLKAARECQMPLTLLGRGSNVLVKDAGVRGAVVCTCAMNRVQVQGTRIEAEAGASMAQIAQAALRAGLTGLEFAAGIPGTVGGGVFMNAGAYDGQMDNVVVRSLYLDAEGQRHEILGDAHMFAYRESVYKKHPDWTIVSAEMELTAGNPEQIREKMDDFAARRRDKQPLNYPSAGSTFKRPTGYFAGQLIERAGLKGAQIGGAQISEKHAGFLINAGGATCEDVEALVAHVKQRVKENSGVTLECEIRIIG